MTEVPYKYMLTILVWQCRHYPAWWISPLFLTMSLSDQMSQRVRKDLGKLTIARALEKEKDNFCLPAREKEKAVARTKAHNLQTDLCQKTILPPARGAKANPRARVCNSRKAREKARKEVAKTPGLAAVAEDGNEKFVFFPTFCFFILVTSQRYAAFWISHPPLMW